jgi:phosphoenolpyruvate mutase
MDKGGIIPEARRTQLKRLLDRKPLIRILEAHNGLTGLIVEHTKLLKEGTTREFDGIWISSLTDSTAKGKPDTGCVDFSSRLATIDEICEVTTKPIVVDMDNGGLPEHFSHNVKTLERYGVSAAVIEDKIGLKKNSLFGTEVVQQQDSIEHFAHKIAVGKEAQLSDDFMIIARIESLILKKGLEDAIQRSASYIEAGADAILIHSMESAPDEILSFCKGYQHLGKQVPLVAIPTSYNRIYEEELLRAGFSMVIYANHLLRAAYPMMCKSAMSILEHNRAHECEEFCMSIQEILHLIPGGK